MLCFFTYLISCIKMSFINFIFNISNLLYYVHLASCYIKTIKKTKLVPVDNYINYNNTQTA